MFSAIFTCSGYFCLIRGDKRRPHAWCKDVYFDVILCYTFCVTFLGAEPNSSCSKMWLFLREIDKITYSNLNAVIEGRVCKKKNLMVAWCELKILSLRVTVWHHEAFEWCWTVIQSDGIFSQHLTATKDSYNHVWTETRQNQQSDCASAQSNQSSLSAWRKLGSLATYWGHN